MGASLPVLNLVSDMVVTNDLRWFVPLESCLFMVCPPSQHYGIPTIVRLAVTAPGDVAMSERDQASVLMTLII